MFSRFTLLLLLFSAPLCAQTDTALLLTPERLFEKDIRARDTSRQRLVALSATRSEEDVALLPFTVWVITAEEILRHGYVTLGDALRGVPGLRVSQPGNASEGETFLMRGLPGNEYVKILINDVPVKPAIAQGISIGAQLPIRQAERIEVMFGPAGTLYGNEACAGVVNIILKETERPIFTQADLGFGKLGYNSLDLMLGGKVGRDRNIFRFSLFGSSTVRERSDLFYDQNLFNTNRYLPFGLDTTLYLNNGNYRFAQQPGDSIPKTAPFSAESRLFGIDLKFRGIRFTYQRMARFDHTALGLNPLAISLSNPSNRLAERMEVFSLSFQRQRKWRMAYNNLSVLTYHVDNTSSSAYVFDRLSAAAYYVRSLHASDDSTRQALQRDIFRQLASDERYAAAEGFDARFETRQNITLRNKLYLHIGLQSTYSGGAALLTHYKTPVEVKLDGSTPPGPPLEPYEPDVRYQFDNNLFSELEWRGRRLYIVGGTAVNFSIPHGTTLAPRLAALYRLDSAWTVRANFTSGFRRPSFYNIANSFYILPSGKISGGADTQLSATETIQSLEAGTRYAGKRGLSAEGIFFLENAYRLARPGQFRQDPGIIAPWRYGYENAPGLALSYWGVQTTARLEGESNNVLKAEERTLYLKLRMELFLQYAKGREWLGPNRLPTADVQNAPRWTTQFRYFMQVGKSEVVITSTRQTASLSRAIAYPDFFQLDDTEIRHPKYISWDFMARYYLSNHFLIYFYMQNVFNRHFAGLDATGTPDDLVYNPQPGRIFRLGINYNMD